MAWVAHEDLDTRVSYSLCRCGHSHNKPFCDGTHAKIGFEAEDVADESTYPERARPLESTGIAVSDDRGLCAHAGFCTNQTTSVWKEVHSSEDGLVRKAIIDSIESCPSGALVYALDSDSAPNEPRFPVEIAVVDDGPYWLTGGIPVETSAGVHLEVRNRVTLCRCGASTNKPLCDGTHRDIGFADSGTASDKSTAGDESAAGDKSTEESVDEQT